MQWYIELETNKAYGFLKAVLKYGSYNITAELYYDLVEPVFQFVITDVAGSPEIREMVRIYRTSEKEVVQVPELHDLLAKYFKPYEVSSLLPIIRGMIAMVWEQRAASQEIAAGVS